MKAKTPEAPQLMVAADEPHNNVPLDNAAADVDQAPAEDNDYGDGDGDMEYAGYDED